MIREINRLFRKPPLLGPPLSLPEGHTITFAASNYNDKHDGFTLLFLLAKEVATVYIFGNVSRTWRQQGTEQTNKAINNL